MQPISVTIVVCGWIWYGSPSWSRAWLWSADSLPDEFSIPDSASIPRKDDHDDWTIEYLPKVDSIVTKELFFPTLKCFVRLTRNAAWTTMIYVTSRKNWIPPKFQ